MNFVENIANIPEARYIILGVSVAVPVLVTVLFSMYLNHKKEEKLIREGIYDPEIEDNGSLILATGLILVFAGAGQTVQTVIAEEPIRYGVIVAFVGVGILVYWTFRTYYMTEKGKKKDIKQSLLD